MGENHHEYLMWMKRRSQVLRSHIQAPFEVFNNNSWEERAFAEDAARILGGCIWPPRSYSCNFCKREFRSAQALGGHMNVHRRDRARLKQNLTTPHNDDDHEVSLNHLHHKNDCKSLGSAHQFSADQNCSHQLIDSCVGTVETSKITSSVPSNISTTQEDFFQHNNMSRYSISWGGQKMVMMGDPDSEPKGVVHAREQISKGLISCNNNDSCVETSLSVGLNSVFGKKLPTDSCGDKDMTCKRPKTNSSSMSSNSLPVFLNQCSNDRRLAFQSADFVLGVGLKPVMEDLDLELRLGKPQKA